MFGRNSRKAVAAEIDYTADTYTAVDYRTAYRVAVSFGFNQPFTTLPIVHPSLPEADKAIAAILRDHPTYTAHAVRA
jgi:hypothetical protein